MFFKKIFKFYKPLLLLAFLIFGCDSSPNSFKDFLYKLSDIDENERQMELENWINNKEDFPIVDNSDVYFIYKEKRDIPIFLSGDMNQWSKSKSQLLRIVGTDYYYLEESYPTNSCLNYSYFVENNLLADPLNFKSAISSNKSCSLLILPEFEYPIETLTQRNFIYTKLDTLKWKSKNNLQDNCFVFKHKLAGSSDPIIIFLNGDKYLSVLKTNITLDNLIYSKSIKPCIALFILSKIQNSVFDDLFLNGVMSGLLTNLGERYNLSRNSIYIGGLLDGGVTAFYALKNYANKLSGVFAQSANFEIDNFRIIEELNNADFSKSKVFYNYGYFEDKDSTFAKTKKFLESKSANFGYKYYNEGRSNFSLRGHLDEALIYLLGNE